ncbi:hypothetical protein M8J77_013595 [Diaphorina citri]|nr:hypothetical protein M8J77_013595 [Diaphorina citri]
MYTGTLVKLSAPYPTLLLSLFPCSGEVGYQEKRKKENEAGGGENEKEEEDKEEEEEEEERKDFEQERVE